MKKNQNSRKHPDQVKQPAQEASNEIARQSEPFIVPDGYFDELPQRVMARIDLKQREIEVNPKYSILLRRTWIPLAVAASVALFFFIRQPSNLAIKTDASDSIAATYHSIEYDPTYADEALLIQEASVTENDEAQIDFKSMSNALNSTDTNGITTEEKIQYLLDENYDTDLITEL